jgi:GMP synthase (glutamine-hydrolysing)
MSESNIKRSKLNDDVVNATAIHNSAQLHSSRKQIAILDFGSQYSHLIARRVRELNVFCELYSCLVTAKTLESSHVIGIIFSGGPSSVYEEGSPHVDSSVWELIKAKNIPVLGICYGMQEIAHHYGGKVSPSTEREYGRAMINISQTNKEISELLFNNVENLQMWMSHGDKVTDMPQNFYNIATTANSPNAAIADPIHMMYVTIAFEYRIHNVNVALCFIDLVFNFTLK